MSDLENPGAETYVYLLQMDPITSTRANEIQAVPLQILEERLEIRNEQNLLQYLEAKHREQQSIPQFVHNNQYENIQLEAVVIEKEHEEKHSSSSISYPVYNIESLNEPTATNYFTSTVENCNNEKDSEDPRHKIKIQNYVHISDRFVLPRAVAVLPSALQIRGHNIISPKRALPTRVRFGPLQGIRHKITKLKAQDLISEFTTSNTPIFLLSENDNYVTHIDVSDKDKSNWLSLLPLGDKETANLWIYEDNGEIYAITTKSVASRKTLALGYSKNYAENLQLPDGLPILDVESGMTVSPNQWRCNECPRSLASATLLQRHIDVCHQDEKTSPQRRYRCRHCTKTFCRLFTLRRHKVLHCTKKTEKSNDIIEMESPPSGPSASMNTEDNRIPSDESFQNYTNVLDFSTNLFDTDRIPSLDMKGNSRLDGEFSPFASSLKDDNGLSNLGFNILHNASEIAQKSESKKQKVESILESCPHCNQVIVKEKKRQHWSECPSQRFECECGRVYRNKKKLTEHIYTTHAADNTLEKVSKSSSDLKTFNCEKCDHTFKRRGMLVNHMWRVHKTTPVALPLERRARLYLCVACPKIYRTAAKRDRHVKVHHPGAENLRAPCIEGDMRTYEPAVCSACPRQYSTRAKLLQHVRAHHPQLAPPVKKNGAKLNSVDTKEMVTPEEQCNATSRSSFDQIIFH